MGQNTGVVKGWLYGHSLVDLLILIRNYNISHAQTYISDLVYVCESDFEFFPHLYVEILASPLARNGNSEHVKILCVVRENLAENGR